MHKQGSHHEMLAVRCSARIKIMQELVYPWKRFWCPRGGQISLADDGFLLDRDSEYAKYYSSDVVAFESISDAPCMVLLGEPGIGKSTRSKPTRAVWAATQNDSLHEVGTTTCDDCSNHALYCGRGDKDAVSGATKLDSLPQGV